MNHNNRNQNEFCPGCEKHCALSSPACPRGEAYADTGELPAQDGAGHPRGRHFHDRHGPRGRRGPILESSRYQEAPLPEKIEMLLRELSMPRHGARDSQDRALFLLAHEEPMTQRDLTDRLGIQPGSASELIGKLEAAGFIVRTPSENDRRTQNVSLTDLGRRRLAELGEEHRSARRRRFDALSEEELRLLCKLLEKLCAGQAPQ